MLQIVALAEVFAAVLFLASGVHCSMSKDIATPGSGCGVTNPFRFEVWSEDGNSPCSLARKIEEWPEPAETCAGASPTVVNGTYGTESGPSDTKFLPRNVLIDYGCDGVGVFPDFNYWISPHGEVGEDNAYFVVDLGCVRSFKRVTLRNTNNFEAMNRGTKDFRILSSLRDPNSGPWTLLAEGTLNDPFVPCPVPKESFAAAGLARYVKFVVMSMYGPFNGGLHYFVVE